ncbi:MAG: fibrobacter succinogenes major paralogous domain-containing protein, partial [Prevotellaceae bacterium]|nr:fibrobacter succinogenes major paralogous domain-containing protein [Prevotellaceae bacterium]
GLKWDKENLVIDDKELFTHDEALKLAKSLNKRLPSLKEFKELIDTGTTYDKVKRGRWFGLDSNLLEKSEKSIFMPAAGERNYYDGSVYYTGDYGYYWSSTVDGDYGRGVDFDSSYVSADNYFYRANGMSVRCVAEF